MITYRQLIVVGLLFGASSLAGAQTAKEPYQTYEGGPEFLLDGPGSVAPSFNYSRSVTSGSSFVGSMPMGASAAVTIGFKGVDQFDLRTILGGSFIPPDTMGAVGTTQFMETTNGVYGIYNKTTGAVEAKLDARVFWANAGRTDGSGLNGDARVMFDVTSQKWIAIQFGKSVADIQIAVSTTSNAMGSWNSTKFTGYSGGVADYPTLAMDKDAVYIGTNNFGAGGAFSGTTLNVISRTDLFGVTPVTTSLKQFATPYSSTSGSNVDRGFAIQGVNSTGPDSGMVIAASLFTNDSLRYNVTNPGTAVASLTPVQALSLADYSGNHGGRQPDGTRNIDTLDERIGASAWEKNGKIYSVYTATQIGSTHTEVRWVVLNAATNAVIQEGRIADPNYDFYEGSLSVNSLGQVVIAYNRSGYAALDGSVSLMARTFNSDSSGALYQTNDLLIHVSDVSNYHNGSAEGAPAVGRQRWGDYSAVSLDPSDDENFWIVGEYAAEWNNAAGGHPGGGGGSSWGTWISAVTLAADLGQGTVPEPATNVLILAGLAGLGLLLQRRSPAGK